MGKILDFIMTGGDWEAMQRIQLMKSGSKLLDRTNEEDKEDEE